MCFLVTALGWLSSKCHMLKRSFQDSFTILLRISKNIKNPLQIGRSVQDFYKKKRKNFFIGFAAALL